jgi:hypothetical protein
VSQPTRLQLAFYKANSGRLFDRLIGLWTRGDYSHVELVFPETGECYSSSPRDGGCRFKQIDLQNGKWELISIPATAQQVLDVWSWCVEQQGKAYDWPGIWGFVCSPFVRQKPQRYFCSEVCVAALQEMGLFKGIEPYRVSPNRLYKLMMGR